MKPLFVMALAVATATAYADCPYPQAPAKIPDGATATLEEMVAGQKAVGEYQKAINDYTICIDKELDDQIAKGGDKLKADDKKKMQQVEAQKHNAAVDQLQAVADRFNEQVKVYKARTADKKG
ncbi:MAG: hypothetical protein JOY74_08505 [Sinobacteraceae bacterium]|nr:hypothetical protein [Nevskiaceae bacterium]MBV9317581.1 hypothetical protein [Gammaproteobacteria bacterium]